MVNEPSKREFNLTIERTDFARLSTCATVILVKYLPLLCPQLTRSNLHDAFDEEHEEQFSRQCVSFASAGIEESVCDDSAATLAKSQHRRKSARCLYCFRSVSAERITRVLSETLNSVESICVFSCYFSRPHSMQFCVYI